MTAVQEGGIALEKTEKQVLKSAGQPDLIIAKRGVETFYYNADDESAVVVAFDKDKRVIAFDDAADWPVEPARAAADADKPVSQGMVRVGMSEKKLRRRMGRPNGITAVGGIETFHWLTSDEVDSAVQVLKGRVIGFWDRPVDEYTQNLPTADRDASTTNG
ncbi:MAG: hypothetical protein AAGA56_06945, partial [Myxococcota bacterium]